MQTVQTEVTERKEKNFSVSPFERERKIQKLRVVLNKNILTAIVICSGSVPH